MLKNGLWVVGTTAPEKFALHTHPPAEAATPPPLLFAGHPTRLHTPVKYGAIEVAVMVPLYPALQGHPRTKLAPLVLLGHPTAMLHVLM